MPSELNQIGKVLITGGMILVIAGFLLLFSDKIPFIGKLPGDFSFKGKNFSFYFPLATSILLSIIISVIMYFFRK